MATYNIMQCELRETSEGSIKVSHKVMQADTLEDANGICDKLNDVNAFYAKTAGAVIKFFYEILKS